MRQTQSNQRCWGNWVQTPAAGLRPPHVVALVSPGVSHITSYIILTHTQEPKGTHPWTREWLCLLSGSVVSWWFMTHRPRNVGMCLSVRVFDSMLRNDDLTVPSVIKSPNASCLLCSFVVQWDRVVTLLLWYVDVSPVSNQSSSPTATGVTTRERLMTFLLAPLVFSISEPSGHRATANTLPLSTEPQLEDRACTNTQMLSGERLLFQHDRKWDLSNSTSILTWNP